MQKCKVCDRVLAKQNRSGYCLKHRESDPVRNWKKRRKKIMKVDLSLDLSLLSDEQLIELLTAIASESLKRDANITPTRKQLEDILIKFQAAEKVRVEKQQKLIEIEAAVVEAIRRWGYKGDFEIRSLHHTDCTSIVIFDRGLAFWEWRLYLSAGSQWYRKGEMIMKGGDNWFYDHNCKNKLKELLFDISKIWGDRRVQIFGSGYSGVVPSQEHLARFLKILDIDDKS